MTTLAYSHTLIAGTPENVNDVQEMFDDAKTVINGNLDGDNLATSIREAAALNKTGSIRRGKSIIATEESRTNTAYGLLTTPDRVQNIVLPTDGLIFVLFQANWKSSSASAGQAAIFIGSNQLQYADGASTTPLSQSANTDSTADSYRQLGTVSYGMKTTAGSQAYTGDVTTGMVAGGGFNPSSAPTRGGGPVAIQAAAGTYDISLQFKATTGSVTVKERKLWVWTMGF